jgi:RNA-directed DNA polymerase
MLAQLKTTKQLAIFLGIGHNELLKLKPEDHYYCFEIPKPGKTEKRIIEAPKGILKYLLERLSDNLQWVYSDHRTDAAHGYIRSTVNDPDKRTIFTNAKKHLGRKFLLNIDLDSFFHQIDRVKLQNIFTDHRFFGFSQECSELLVNLVSYHGRLPMGSPTSPPLSNFATVDLDLDLLRWAGCQRIVYSRFVDDLSFSSNRPLMQKHFEMISDMLQMHHFRPDPEKTKWFSESDRKEVTGLLVGSEISLPADYITELEREIDRLAEVKKYSCTYPDYAVLEWIRKLNQVIDGRLSFVKAVYGSSSPIYRGLLKRMKNSYSINSDTLSLSWRYAGYEYFSM